MKSIKIILCAIVSGFIMSACHSTGTKKKIKKDADPGRTTLSLNGKSVPEINALANYMILRGNESLVSISFRWDSRKEGQVNEFNRMFMINAFGLNGGSYHVVQLAKKPGTGGMAYVIRENNQGDQQNFGVLKNGSLSFSKIDTLHHLCSGNSTVTLQDNNSNDTITFVAKWNDLQLVKSRLQ